MSSMNPVKNGRLAVKFLAPVVGLILIMQLAVGAMVLRNERRTLEHSRDQLAREYAGTIAALAAEHIAADHRDRLKRFVTALKERDPNVSWAGFYHSDGSLLVDCGTSPQRDHLAFEAPLALDGKPLGRFVLHMNPDLVEAAVFDLAAFLSLTFLLTLAAVAGGIYFLFQRVINTPLTALSMAVARIAGGDLTTTISGRNDDEIGRLGADIDLMADNLRGLLQQLGDNADTLSENAQALASVNRDLNQQLGNLNQRTETVTESTNELTHSMTMTTNKMEESAQETQAIAHSVREMRQALDAMAASSEQARLVTRDMVGIVNRASADTQNLTQAAGEITTITSVINDVADQTKLLALNATIEAARAGELGRGFGVVASEVKELARQTNNAVEEITGKIEVMQKTATATAGEMERIKAVMGEVENMVAAIAGAVVQQATTVQAVSGSVTGIADSLNTVSETVAESAQISQNMAFDIKQVDEAGSQLRGAGDRIQAGGGSMATMAAKLQQTLAGFKLR